MKRSNGNGRTETGLGSFYGQLVGNLKSGGGLMGRAEPGMEGVQCSRWRRVPPVGSGPGDASCKTNRNSKG